MARRRMFRKKTIQPKRKGQHKITFKEGGEHASTGTPAGQKIPASKKRAARSGKLGLKAERQELFRENVLSRGKGRRRSRKKTR